MLLVLEMIIKSYINMDLVCLESQCVLRSAFTGWNIIVFSCFSLVLQIFDLIDMLSIGPLW